MKLTPEGWLEPSSSEDITVTRMPLPPFVKAKGRKYRKFRAGPSRISARTNKGKPSCLIIHYDALPNGRKTAERFQSGASSVSSHMIILRDGGIIQHAPVGGLLPNGYIDPAHPSYVTHHAGLRSWEKRPYIGGHKIHNPNDVSVGIDFSNVGPLKKRGKDYFWWAPKDKYKTKFNGPVAEIDGRYWEAYTDEAIDTGLKVCRLIIERFGIKPDCILGHSDVSTRKIDPGPAFPLAWLIEQAYSAKSVPPMLDFTMGRSGATDPELTFAGPPLPPSEELPLEYVEEAIDAHIDKKEGNRTGISCWKSLLDQIIL